MNDEAVEEFLAHYGVKGMKWGVRKNYYRQAAQRRRERNLKKYGPRDRRQRTPTQKANRIKRTNRRVNNALIAVTAASFISAKILENKAAKQRWERQQRREDDFFNNWKTYKPPKSVTDLINEERKVKVDAIDKTFREGFIDKAQRDAFIEKMNKRYDRKVADALKDIK